MRIRRHFSGDESFLDPPGEVEREGDGDGGGNGSGDVVADGSGAVDRAKAKL